MVAGILLGGLASRRVGHRTVKTHMLVDVTSEIVIARPRHDVAGFCTDPENAPEWYVNIKTVAWKTPPPLRIGAQITFGARFAGRRLAYTYEVTEWVPEERLMMR